MAAGLYVCLRMHQHTVLFQKAADKRLVLVPDLGLGGIYSHCQESLFVLQLPAHTMATHLPLTTRTCCGCPARPMPPRSMPASC